MSSGDLLYLIHILERIERIEIVASRGKDAFLSDPILQDAVIRNFEVIGEAVKRLSPSAKASHPSIPWRQIAGFRDVLIHNYMGVDVLAVWNVIVRDLPGLKQATIALHREADS